jgi:branched-chain amino acid transport system permease protein
MLSNIKKKDLFIYLGVLAFALIAPNVFPDYRIQFTFWLVLIILAITWNIQGGEMISPP